jgi:succinate dehydrogenase / fumarate reductase membrane anchor subunit
MAKAGKSYRTPLGQARGLGAAKHGVGQFIAERVTAVALIPLVIWGIWSAMVVARGGYEGAIRWLGSPVNAVLLVLTLLVGFWHMQIGLRVVIEDYIGKPFSRSALLILNLFVCVLFAALSIFAVLKVAFTTGAV